MEMWELYNKREVLVYGGHRKSRCGYLAWILDFYPILLHERCFSIVSTGMLSPEHRHGQSSVGMSAQNGISNDEQQQPPGIVYII